MTQPKQLKEEINNLMKEWMKECAKECCEKCQGIRKGSTGTEYYCLITNCPCHQSPDNSVEGWEGEFEIKYCRGSRGLENKGKPMDKWFFPETLTPFEIKSFIRRLLKDSRSQVAPMGASQWKQHGIKYGYWNFFETMKQTENNILKLVYSLVESDAGFESDCVQLDLLNKRPVSEREKVLAELVSKIYRIIHPLFSTCQHNDWEKETKDLLTKLK